MIFLLTSAAILTPAGESFAGTDDQASTEFAVTSTYYMLTVIVVPPEGGWLDPANGTHVYEAGTIVQVLWWHTTDWLLSYYDINGTIIQYPTRPYNITMNANYVLRAVYVRYYAPTISLSPLQATIYENSSVAFTATVNNGWPPYHVEWCLNNAIAHTDSSPNETPLSFEWTFSPTSPGTYSVFARVQDTWYMLPREQWPKSGTATVTVNDLSNITIKAYCLAEGLDVNLDILMDGSPTSYKTPHTFGNLPGTHSFTVPSTDLSSHLFKQWSTNQTTTTITATSDGTYMAYYQAKYSLNIATGTGGTTNPPPGTYTYFADSVVSVTANPYTGYHLDHWELDGANSTNPAIYVTMNTTHNLKATYAQIQCTLNISMTEGGNVTLAPGAHTYGFGTTASIAASPLSGYYLDRWELNSVYVGVANPLTIKIYSNNTLNAVFNQLNPGHDVSVKWIDCKLSVGQSYPLPVEVTVMNVGSYVEILNVTLSANSTFISGQNITLSSGELATLFFTWNTTGFALGRYTLYAAVNAVAEETNVEDNVIADEGIIMTIAGDVNGDFKTDGKDVAIVAKAYGTKPSDDKWDRRADINSDGKADGRDIAIAARNFGLMYP